GHVPLEFVPTSATVAGETGRVFACERRYVVASLRSRCALVKDAHMIEGGPAVLSSAPELRNRDALQPRKVVECEGPLRARERARERQDRGRDDRERLRDGLVDSTERFPVELSGIGIHG